MKKINNRVFDIFQTIDELNGGGGTLEMFQNLNIHQLKQYYMHEDMEL